MGRLTDFQDFIDGRAEVLGRVDERLCKVQEHYETFFGELARVKEQELDQLEVLVNEQRDRLPTWLNEALDEAGRVVAVELDMEVEALTGKVERYQAAAEELRTRSANQEAEVHAQNRELDDQEEALKTRNEDLLARIDRHNATIREMSSGFGFMLNLLDMRKLRSDRLEIEKEQCDVAAHIETLRHRWAEAEQDHVVEEDGLQQQWLTARREAAEARTQLQWLLDSRERIHYRTTLQRAVVAHPDIDHESGPDDPACPRCSFCNPVGARLCRVCGIRLGDDAAGLAGSLEEIAEAARIHDTFARGMEACQQIIGLVRGLLSGHEAFGKSVGKMITSERRYPIPLLEIDVPADSRAYGALFEELEQAMDVDHHRHPLVFAQQVEELLDTHLTEAAIQQYFETMGEELSRCADAQW